MWHSAEVVGGWGLFYIYTLSLPHQAWLSLCSISIWPCVCFKSFSLFVSRTSLVTYGPCVCMCEYVCVIIYILTTALIYLPPAQEHWGFPGALVVKNPPANVGDVRGAGSISGWKRSPGGGHGHSLQYSCLENSMDRGARRTTAYRVTKNHTLLSD